MSTFDESFDGPVRLTLEGPQSQNRASVFFRIILAIPHMFVAGVLGFVLFFATIAGWFAALVLGRMPAGLHEFISSVLDYMTRFYAYAVHLLSDRYPPFALRAEYAVNLDVDPPGRLNRAAVLFRFILIVPTMLVVQILASGIYPIVFVAWLILLISARMPTSLYMALASMLRYQMRAYAYVCMLTSEYPRGLFGDDDIEEIATAYGGEPPDGLPPPAFALPDRPRITRLVLSKAAKRIIVLTIVVGVALGAVVQITAALTSLGDKTAEQLDAQRSQLDVAVDEFVVAIQSCAVDGDIRCVRDANRELADALTTFQAELRAIELPQVAIEQAEVVDDDVTEMLRLLRELNATEDPNEYQATAAEFQRVANRFDADYERLYQLVVFN